MRKSAALGSFLLCGLLVSSCGHSPRATQATPKTHLTLKTRTPTATPTQTSGQDWLNPCYPPWEQTDLHIVSQTKLPVPTVLVEGNAGLTHAITPANTADWLGDAPGTPDDAPSLLAGWSVTGLEATRGPDSITAQPVPGGFQILITAPSPTPLQSSFVAPAGVGILTIVPDWTSDPSLQARTLQAVLQDFLNSVATPPGGVAATAYFSVQEASPPSSYDAPGGGPPVEPSAS